MSFTQAHVLIRYPIQSVQTACVVIPNQVAPGLGWDFLKPSYEGNLDYGSPNGFLRSQAKGGFLAKGWTSKEEPEPTQYFEFSIQPRENCIVQLEGISMAILSSMVTYGRNAQAVSPQHWEVQLTLSNTPDLKWTVFSQETPIEEDAAYTVHIFREAGNFSNTPLIPGGTTATFRIYGFAAAPLIPLQPNLPPIEATGGLIHANVSNQTQGLDLTLHGTIYCEKKTYNLLNIINIKHPLMKSVKQQDGLRAPTLALSELLSL